jgi:hypothetical protein
MLGPIIRAQAAELPAMQAFAEGTFARLAEPKDKADRPAEAVFSERYRHFGEHYVWMRQGRSDAESES